MPTAYVDVTRLGDGAEGGAWAAVDSATGRRVVLKRVDAARRVAVRHAFAVLRRVASPHLPSPRALEPDGAGGLWFVCDRVDGRALPAERTTVVGALAEATAVAHALAAIHDAGTHHADVSASNVIVTPTGGVVLVDLGHLGRLGAGTPGYLAPEVLGGGGGSAADRFALGCLLCLRLCGEVPWRRPVDLLAVRDDADVRARLVELAGDRPIDPPVLRLLVALLRPDPARRFADSAALVHALRSLRDAAGDPEALAADPSPWSAVPLASATSHRPYRGIDLEAIVAALASPRPPRLVAIVGPDGSGRGRIALELVHALQLRDIAARQCDPDRMGAQLGDPHASWYEAWTHPDAPGPVVLAAASPPSWSGVATQSDPGHRAALLRAGATLATRTLVLPIEARVADGLRDATQVAVVDVAPLARDELVAILEPALTRDVAAWADALLAVTGGWAGRVGAAIEACARAGLSAPDPNAIERVLGEVGLGPELPSDVAARVLVARWTGDREALRELPSDLHDGERPLGAAVVAARRRLGSGLADLARALVAETTAPIGLELALDADDPDAIAAALVAEGAGDRGTRGRVLSWIRARGGAAVPLPAVRALQRLGRPDAALVRVDAAQAAGCDPNDDPDDVAWTARGLRWRLLVDAGRAALAAEEAITALQSAAHEGGSGMATALLWGAMATITAGAEAAAQGWLSRAGELAKIAEADDVRARVEQLSGNLALAHGDLARAREHFAAAAVAFARAGEAMGATLVQGSLAAIAIPTWATQSGIDHGRAALRGLLARGQRAAMLEAALNLVQLLARIDARDEMARLHRVMIDLLGDDADPLVHARLQRLGAERIAIAARTDRRLADRVDVAFADAAIALAAIGRAREAIEARLRAAAWARRVRRYADADAHLREAIAIDADDADSQHGRALESVAQALARAPGPDAAAAAGRTLARLPDIATLRARGRLDLAWSRDRLLLAIVRRQLPPGAPARRAAAHRLTQTLEAIMSKTAPTDRSAVRTALDEETGDRGVFTELLEELGDDLGPPARPRVRGRAVEATRRDGLLRIYRRLAREDDLPRLLEQVVDAVMELTDAERGAVVVLPTEHTERVEVTRELSADGQGVRFSRSVIERVLQSGEPVLSVDAASDDRFDGSRSISHLNLRSVLAVPLVFRGELLGAAYVDHRLRRGNFDEGDLAHMEEFAELAALAVAHARALAALQAKAQAQAAQGQKLQHLLEAQKAETAALRAKVEAGGSEAASGRAMIGSSAAMARVFRLIDRLAETDVPVVIYGESGTGKELVAKAIHAGGPRRAGPFVAENCGAIPETLLESVLFGHARGAFTGAHVAKAGLFEAADGGTIFLDEVGEMSPGMQAKLLRVLQEGTVRRVGENRERRVDVRVIAASNRDLEQLVAAGTFRSDLFYRINVVKLGLPPLRERIEDLPALVEHFIARHGGSGRPLSITPAAMRALARHRWPGNVRELENEVQRWVALSDGTVDVDGLSPAIAQPLAGDDVDPEDLRIRPRVERIERELIERALARTQGNQTRAADLLGLSRFGLQKKLRRLEEDA